MVISLTRSVLTGAPTDYRVTAGRIGECVTRGRQSDARHTGHCLYGVARLLLLSSACRSVCVVLTLRVGYGACLDIQSCRCRARVCSSWLVHSLIAIRISLITNVTLCGVPDELMAYCMIAKFEKFKGGYFNCAR